MEEGRSRLKLFLQDVRQASASRKMGMSMGMVNGPAKEAEWGLG